MKSHAILQIILNLNQDFECSNRGVNCDFLSPFYYLISTIFSSVCKYACSDHTVNWTMIFNISFVTDLFLIVKQLVYAVVAARRQL